LAVPEITRATLAKFHHDLRTFPYQAIAALRGRFEDMFVFGPECGDAAVMASIIPRKHIGNYPKKARGFLSACRVMRGIRRSAAGEMKASVWN